MTTAELEAWMSGYEAAIDQALHVVDAMRGPGNNNLATPILLRIRAELLALRQDHEAPQAKAA